MIPLKDVLSDLAQFGDLGTDAPNVVSTTNGATIRLTRDSSELEITLQDDGRVSVRSDGDTKRYATFRALLASPLFGDLGRWADSQSTLLRSRVEKETIPIHGIVSGQHAPINVREFDDRLVGAPRVSDSSVQLVIVDGPAGIGKTGLIRSLSYDRAKNYRSSRRPLVLHVESRGECFRIY
jgi:hypothetical protein